MMVMPANHSSPVLHYLAGKHPGSLGWLIGPTARRKTKLRPWLPFALDNDAYSAWVKKVEWDLEAWRSLLRWASKQSYKPLWVLVPDVVANHEATLSNWGRFAPEAASFGWPLAFAVQDGMSMKDVPASASVVFVGGSTEFKWSTLPMWVSNFPRVHVGRVNCVKKLQECEALGVSSVDGTGWFRDETRQDKIPALTTWLEESYKRCQERPAPSQPQELYEYPPVPPGADEPF
jgi:hypothetical protein